MLGTMMRRRIDPPQPVRRSSAGFAGMIRSSRAQANRRRSTDATVLFVLPEAGLPFCRVSWEVDGFGEFLARQGQHRPARCAASGHRRPGA